MTKYKELYLSSIAEIEALKKGVQRLKKSQLKYKIEYERILPEYQKMQKEIFYLSTENNNLRKTVGIIEKHKGD